MNDSLYHSNKSLTPPPQNERLINKYFIKVFVALCLGRNTGFVNSPTWQFITLATTRFGGIGLSKAILLSFHLFYGRLVWLGGLMVFFSSYFKTVALCVAAIISVALAAQENQVKMGVLALECKDRSFGKRLGESLLHELRQNKNYNLVNLVDSADFNKSNVAEAAKEAGLDFVVFGSAEASAQGKTRDAYRDSKGELHKATYSTDYSVLLNITVLDVETNKIITSSERDTFTRLHGQTRSSASMDDFFITAEKPLKRVAFTIMREIHPLDPAVIQIKGKELTLDMGSSDGITEKQRFAIVREGKPLYNRNGELIGMDVIEIAHITITRVEANVSYAKIAKVMKDPDTKKEYEIQVGDTAKMQDVTKGRTTGERFGGLLKDLTK
jgi:hypothetical protein